MNAFHEAYKLADIVLNRSNLNLEFLTETYCPVALGKRNNGFLIPHHIAVPSLFARQYFTSLEMQDMRGLKLILSTLQKIREQFEIILSTVDDYSTFAYMADTFCPQGLSSFTFPIVEMRGGLTRREAYARQVTIAEYMALCGFKYVSSVFNHIIQIVLFGFPLTFEIAELFDLDAGAYLPSRLFEGAGDVLIGGMNIVSNFAPFEAYTTQDPALTDALTRFANTFSVDSRKRELVNIQSLMVNTSFLGPNSELVAALARSGMFDRKYASYNQYLTRNTGMIKLGYPLWSKIADGRRLNDNAKIKMSVDGFAGMESALSQSNYTGAELNVTMLF